MPKAMNKCSPEQSTPPSEVHESVDTQAEIQAQIKNQIQKISFCPAFLSHSTSTMFMPYIKGPIMNWTVDDGLYHRFLKWHLKCETILECELANLPEKQKCQKVMAWLGDFGMDLYVSWSLPKEELTLDTIWDRFEEFSKPQSNEVRAQFDLLTSFFQGNRNVDEWYNAVQAQVNFAKYPLESAKILHRDIFWFFMRDEDFVTKTINERKLIFRNFPPVRSNNWPRKWRVQRPLPNILDR